MKTLMRPLWLFISLIVFGVCLNLSGCKTTDSTVYSVRFCALIENSSKYDGKLVRTQAIYHLGTEEESLKDNACAGWIRINSLPRNEETEKIFIQMSKIRFPVRPRVDVIGRYKANILDPHPNEAIPWSKFAFVHYLEITELKGVEVVKSE